MGEMLRALTKIVGIVDPSRGLTSEWDIELALAVYSIETVECCSVEVNESCGASQFRTRFHFADSVELC